MQEPCNMRWDAMLKIFHKIRETNPEDAKIQYDNLKQSAEKDSVMTGKQREGIMARCDYRIHLIDNPNEQPFANYERKETRNLPLDKAQSNGKP